MATIWLGGCIMNRSPNDEHGDNCDCFKMEFVACFKGVVYRIQMCREWVRYMAERRAGTKWIPIQGQVFCTQRTADVVTCEVARHFGISRDGWLTWHHHAYKPLGKNQRAVAGDYGALPTIFPEVVMDCRYGRIVHVMKCSEVMEMDKFKYYIRPDEFSGWTGWSKSYMGLVCENIDKYKQFIQAMERACSRSEACKLTGLDDRKKVVAMIELLKLKTQEHEANEQQVSAPLPV